MISLNSALFRRAIKQIVQLAAIIQAIENAYSLCSSLKVNNKTTLTEQLKVELENVIKAKFSTIRIINCEVYEAAQRLMEYYIAHRMVLSGCNCTTEKLTNDVIIQNFLNEIKLNSQ